MADHGTPAALHERTNAFVVRVRRAADLPQRLGRQLEQFGVLFDQRPVVLPEHGVGWQRDAEARAFLAPKGDFKSAYNSSRMKYKLPGLQEAALLRVRDGTTSLEEVIRVLSPATKPTAPTTTAPGAATAAKPTTATTASTPNAKVSSTKPLVPGSKPTTPLTKPPTKPKT